VTKGDKLKSPGVLGISIECKKGTLLTVKGPEHNNKHFSLQLASHRTILFDMKVVYSLNTVNNASRVIHYPESAADITFTP